MKKRTQQRLLNKWLSLLDETANEKANSGDNNRFHHASIDRQETTDQPLPFAPNNAARLHVATANLKAPKYGVILLS